MRKPLYSVAVALMSVAVIAGGCSPKSVTDSPQVASSFEEETITQAEAQAMWDELAAVLSQNEWQTGQQAIIDAVTKHFEVGRMIGGVFEEDIRSRVLEVSPNAFAMDVGDYAFAGYAVADGGESGEQYPPSRQEVRDSIAGVTDVDLVRDAFVFWESEEMFWNTGESYPEPRPAPQVNTHAYSVLTDALMLPSLAPTRVVAVEGNEVLVTFAKRMTLDPSVQYDADWTNRYAVEQRDGKWVIVGVTNLGDYTVACAELDIEKATAKPTEAEVVAAFNASNPSEIVWMGQDSTGLWWAVVTSTTDMTAGDYTRTETYSTIGYRNAQGTWQTSSGANGGAVQVDSQFPVPNEVVAALKKAGVAVADMR